MDSLPASFAPRRFWAQRDCTRARYKIERNLPIANNSKKISDVPIARLFCSCFRSRGTWILSSWMKNLLSPSLCNFYYPMEANEQLVSLQFLSFFITNEVFNNFYIRLTSTATTAHWNFHNNFHRKLLLWNIFFSTESFNFLFEDFSHEPRLTPTIRDRMN